MKRKNWGKYWTTHLFKQGLFDWQFYSSLTESCHIVKNDTSDTQSSRAFDSMCDSLLSIAAINDFLKFTSVMNDFRFDQSVFDRYDFSTNDEIWINAIANIKSSIWSRKLSSSKMLSSFTSIINLILTSFILTSRSLWALSK